MDVLSYILMKRIFDGTNSEPIYEYLTIASHDQSALSALAAKMLSEMEYRQTGETITRKESPISKLALLGIFTPFVVS